MIRLLQDFSYSSMFLKFPCLILFFILLIRCFDLGTYGSLGLCDGPVFSCAILFLLTSLPLLLFLGEAERYLSHLSYFVILGVVIMANGLNLKWIPYCLIGYGLLYFLVEVCFLRDPRKARAAEDQTVVFPKEAKFSDKSRHLSISRPKHVAGLYWRPKPKCFIPSM